MAAHMPSRLYRSRSQKMIAGVSGGLGDYFDVDPVLIRLLFVVTAFISGVGILAYIVLWIVVPFEGDDSPRLDTLRRDFDDLSGRVREYVEPMRGGGSSGAGRGTTASAAPGSPAPGGVPTATTSAEAGDVSPASRSATTTTTATTTATIVDDGDGDDDPLTRTLAYEEATMTSESVTTSRLPVRYDPAASAIDPLSEPLPEIPPRISSSAPASPAADVTTTADAPYAVPGAAPHAQTGNAPAGHTHQMPPLGPPPPFMGGSAAAAAATAAPTDRRKRRQHWAGAILIVLGLLILGNNLGLLWWVEPEFMLPLILVGGGAWLLFGRGRRG